jgi:C2 domain
VEGKDLIAMDSNGTSDPYGKQRQHTTCNCVCIILYVYLVYCIVGAKKKKTKTIRDTLNPQWTVGDPEIFKLYQPASLSPLPIPLIYLLFPTHLL